MHNILVALVSALVGGGAVYIFRNKISSEVAAAEAKAKSAAESTIKAVEKKI